MVAVTDISAAQTYWNCGLVSMYMSQPDVNDRGLFYICVRSRPKKVGIAVGRTAEDHLVRA